MQDAPGIQWAESGELGLLSDACVIFCRLAPDDPDPCITQEGEAYLARRDVQVGALHLPGCWRGRLWPRPL